MTTMAPDCSASADPVFISSFPSARLTEADLSTLWESQRFPAEALRARGGTLFRVIYRGRRTGGAGPDFRDAIISGPDGLLQGDIELHVRSSDFRRHGHHRDPAYDGLALHLVFRNDDGHDTELACGRHVSVVALADWTDLRAREIRAWIAEPPLWQEPCRSAVARLGADATGAALDRLGDLRFRGKAALAARELRTSDPDDLLWSRTLEALGYGGQRELMLAIAEGLPWRRLRLRLAGLRAGERAAAATTALAGTLDNARLRLPLILRPLRPANRPEARIRGAAALAGRFTLRGIQAHLTPHLAAAAAGRPAALVRALTVEGAIGRARAVEILSNAVLPVTAADDPLASEAAYRHLQLPARYGPVRHLHTALAGAVPLNARRQQGMLYLLKRYCTQGGCGKCPLS